MVKGTVAVPKLELLLSTRSVEGPWLQGSGWQGSLLCQGYPHPTGRAAPHPAGLPHALPQPPEHCGAGTGSWALSLSSWLMSP